MLNLIAKLADDYQEIITGTIPYPQCRMDGHVVAKIFQKILPNRTKHFSEDERGDRMWGLLVKCWDFNPVSRPTAHDVFDLVCVY